MAETKKILAVMSEWGYWGIELVGPLKKLEAAGYSFDYVTPKGKRSPVLPPSNDTTYVDPPLGVCVTTAEDAKLVKAFEKTNRLDGRRSLSDVVPGAAVLPPRAVPAQLRGVLRGRQDGAGGGDHRAYDALLLVGGSGPIVDMVNNQRVHDLILGF